MSLVGSLEDLGLGDILQIISLSRKSGVLLLRSEHGEGQILFDQGLIRGAFVKGGPTALRELLAQRDVVAEDALESAWQDAHSRGVPLARVLVDRTLVAEGDLDTLRRDNIEGAVLRMFGWPTGEFSFEVRDLEGDAGEELFVAPGINPQFLALEGTRRADELDLEPEEDAAEPVFAGEDAAAEPVAAEEPCLEAEVASDDDEPLAHAEPLEAAAEPPEPLEAAAEHAEPLESADEPVGSAALVEEPAEAELADEEVEDAALAEAEPWGDAEPAETLADAEPAAALGAADAAEARPAAAEEAPTASRTPRRGPSPPVVVIDPDLAMLEWLKEALAEDYGQVHIFQRTDLGVERIRQYLARAQVPLVLLAADAPADPVAGGRDPYEMIGRLKRQSARLPVLLLIPHGEASPPPRAGTRPDGTVAKPSATHLADERCVRERAEAAERLRESARSCEVGPRASRPVRGAGAHADVARLKEVSARLRDPASGGEVLPQVIAFAAQSFRRVALFMIREDEALGLAQVGLDAAGGPDAAGLREVQLPCREPAWFRAVLETRHPVRSAPHDEGDRRLAGRLGTRVPDEAYVAPIESGGHVVALLYADNLPGGEPMQDTSALEVVLHEAGMALDRAVLERALEEAEA